MPRILLSLLLLALGCGAIAGEARSDLRDAMQRMQRSYRVLRLAFNAQERPMVDPADLLAVTGERPADLHAWVAEHTHWLPYRGSLRGARGVLIDGGGSHCDRALLLAACLREAGFDVQLRRGRLDDEQVAELLPAVLERSRVGLADLPAPGLDDPELERRLAAAAGVGVERYRQQRAALDLRSQETQEEVVLRSLQQQERLAAIVGERLERDAIDPAPIFAEHWWVAYRDAGAEGADWRILDPLQDAEAPEPLAAEAQAATGDETGPVPPEQRHRLRVRAIAEVWMPDGRQEHVLLERELDPRQLWLSSLQLLVAPLEWNVPEEIADDPEAVREHLLEQDEWMPVLRVVDGDAFHDQAIRADGTINEDPAENVVQAKLGNAAEALGGMGGGGGAKGRFTALWWEWTWLGPGADEQPQRRMQMDVIGPAMRSADWNGSLGEAERMRRATELTAVTQVLVQAGRTTAPVVRRLGMVHRLRNQSAMLGSLDALARDQRQAFGERLANLELHPTKLLNWHLLRWAWSRHRERVFVDRPQVIAMHVVQRPGEADHPVRLTIDVIGNGVGVLPGRADDEPSAARVRLEQGVLDTVLETVTLRGIGRSIGHNPSQLMSEQQQPWQLVVDPASIVDPDWRARIAADHDRGLLAVAPQAAGEDGRFGWWRVAPDGTCLGMGVNGWGPESVDYLSTMTIPQRLLFEANMFMLAHGQKVAWACMICQLSSMGLTMGGVNVPEAADIACEVVCAGAG